MLKKFCFNTFSVRNSVENLRDFRWVLDLSGNGVRRLQGVHGKNGQLRFHHLVVQRIPSGLYLELGQ